MTTQAELGKKAGVNLAEVAKWVGQAGLQRKRGLIRGDGPQVRRAVEIAQRKK